VSIAVSKLATHAAEMKAAWVVSLQMLVARLAFLAIAPLTRYVYGHFLSLSIFSASNLELGARSEGESICTSRCKIEDIDDYKRKIS